MASSKSKKTPSNQIVRNKKATFEFFIQERFEAGLILEGWEVKSLRAGKVNITDSYVFIKQGEVWLTGLHITPLSTASTHVKPEPDRYKKLLLNRKEINTLVGAIEQKGFTLVALSLYWKFGRAKVELGLAKGKKEHDKRQTSKNRDWDRQKQRILKDNQR